MISFCKLTRRVVRRHAIFFRFARSSSFIHSVVTSSCQFYSRAVSGCYYSFNKFPANLLIMSRGMATSGAPQKHRAFIALGSNLGDRIEMIEEACRRMSERGIRIIRTSGLWETEPMYVLDQDRFVNGACEVRRAWSLTSWCFQANGCIDRNDIGPNPAARWASGHWKRHGKKESYWQGP